MDPREVKRQAEFMKENLRRDRRELRALPEGRLLEIKRGGRRYYLCRHKGRYQGITKDTALVHQLMRNEFLMERIRRYEAQLATANIVCKTLEPVDTPSIMAAIKEARPFLREDGCLRCEEAEAWAREKYRMNTLYREQCIHRTGQGIATRSKEEKEIGNILEQKGIIYRYDWLQQVGERWVTPDFTIYRASDGKVIYWEHFGMMKNERYKENAYDKILHYECCGLHLWDNFIITFPSRNGALDTVSIHRLCEVFLR